MSAPTVFDDRFLVVVGGWTMTTQPAHSDPVEAEARRRDIEDDYGPGAADAQDYAREDAEARRERRQRSCPASKGGPCTCGWCG